MIAEGQFSVSHDWPMVCYGLELMKMDQLERVGRSLLGWLGLREPVSDAVPCRVERQGFTQLDAPMAKREGIAVVLVTTGLP